MKNTKRDESQCLRLLLQGALLLMSLLWAQMAIAASCTSSTSQNVVFSATVRSSAPAGNVVFKSPLTTTRYSCTQLGYNNSPVDFIVNGYPGTTDRTNGEIDATQINAQLIWSTKIISGGTASGANSGTISFNKVGSVRIGSAANTNTPFIVDITWQVLLTAGPGPITMAKIAALPAGISLFRIDGNMNGAGNEMYYSGFSQIRVVPTTCAVSADDVRLPTVRSQQLAVAGQPQGDTPFTINLRNCTEGGGVTSTGIKARTYFDGAAIDLAKGRLNIDAGGANNLQVELLDNNNSSAPAVINLAGATGAQGVNAVPITNGAATMHYVARYFPNAPVTLPGKVTTRVNYTIEYP